MYFNYSTLIRLLSIAATAAALLLLSGCANREERIASALTKADQARQRNETSEALLILGKAALKNPDSAALQEALGNTQLEDNDPQSAISSYAKAIELDADRQRLWVSIAELNIRLGEELAATQALDNYLDHFPDDFLAWKNYAALQEELGDLNAAIKAYLEWNRIRPSAGPALKLGHLFNKMGNTPQARSWISQAAAYVNDPGAKDALAALIELEINIQQYLPASTWLEQYDSRYGTATTDPRIQSAKVTIGKWRQAQQEIADAAALLEERRKAFERQTEEARLNEEKARLEHEALLAEADQRSENDPPNSPIILDENRSETVGETASLNKEPTALVNADADAALSSSGADYLEAARSAVDRSDTTEAIDLYWRALGPESDNASIWFELAQVYMDNREWLDAEACILEAKRREPRSPAIASSYLLIIAQTQNPAKAVREAEALINLFPRDPSIALANAQLLRKANAPRQRIIDAYRDFLTKAEPGAKGFDEATGYLGQ